VFADAGDDVGFASVRPCFLQSHARSEAHNLFTRLQEIDDHGSDGMTLRHRLEPLMIKIEQDITQCGNVCDTYAKRNILGAFFNILKVIMTLRPAYPKSKC